MVDSAPGLMLFLQAVRPGNQKRREPPDSKKHRFGPAEVLRRGEKGKDKTRRRWEKKSLISVVETKKTRTPIWRWYTECGPSFENTLFVRTSRERLREGDPGRIGRTE